MFFVGNSHIIFKFFLYLCIAKKSIAGFNYQNNIQNSLIKNKPELSYAVTQLTDRFQRYFMEA